MFSSVNTAWLVAAETNKGIRRIGVPLNLNGICPDVLMPTREASRKVSENEVPLGGARSEHPKEPLNIREPGGNLKSRQPSDSKAVTKRMGMLRYFVLWLFGVPVSVIVWLWVLGVY